MKKGLYKPVDYSMFFIIWAILFHQKYKDMLKMKDKMM